MTGATDAGSRERLVDAAAALMRRQGYAATGLAAIVDAAGTTKGSLYFHFPGGKEELTVVVMEREAARFADAIDAVVDAAPDVGGALTGVIDALRADLVASGFRAGCPITPVAVDVAAFDSAVSAVCRVAFARWQERIAHALIGQGVDADIAADDAAFVLSAIEGALLLARSERNTRPLDAVSRRLQTWWSTSARSASSSTTAVH